MKRVSSNERETNKAIRSMVKVAISVVLLARPLRIIGNVDVTTGAKGLVGIGFLMAILAGYSRFARVVDKSQRPVNGLLSTAMALTLLIVPFKVLGSMDVVPMAKAGTAILGIFAILVAVSKVMKQRDANRLTKISWQLTKVAIGLAAFGFAMQIASKNTGPEMANSILVLLGIFGILVLASKAMRLVDANRLKAISWQLTKVAIGLAAFGLAMMVIGKNEWETVKNSLILLAGVLGVMVFVGKSLTKPRVANLTKIIWMLIPMSTALGMFGISMLVVGNIHWTKILQSIFTIAAIFGGFILLSKFLSTDKMIGLQKIIWALIPLSASLIAFGVGMLIVGNIHWTKILISLGTLALVLLILVGFSKLMAGSGASSLKLIALSSTLVILSVGLVALSVGLLALGNLAE